MHSRAAFTLRAGLVRAVGRSPGCLAATGPSVGGRTVVGLRWLSAESGKFNVRTYNEISPVGLGRYPAERYVVGPDISDADTHAIMLRSKKLTVSEHWAVRVHPPRLPVLTPRPGTPPLWLPHAPCRCVHGSYVSHADTHTRARTITPCHAFERRLTVSVHRRLSPMPTHAPTHQQPEDVPPGTRAIARCGAGTNNCNVDYNTALGIPVFNSPGANANSVKELVLCAMLLGARGILQGANHMKALAGEGKAHERVEKDKKRFAGRELYGKTLGVLGLGAIGSMVAEAAMALGMKVTAYDPQLTVENALRLHGRDLELRDKMQDVVVAADFLSIHVPYMESTHHLLNQELLLKMKPDAVLLNFARGELVDTAALRKIYDAGAKGRYICDFPCDDLWDHDQCIVIPHLGASTEEAEERSAAMAADTLRSFLETGAIRHSVNFPTTELSPRPEAHVRLVVVNKNEAGVLASIMNLLGDAGINVQQQINTSRGAIGYTVIDTDATPAVAKSELTFDSWKALQRAITKLDGVLTTRIIQGARGTGYLIKRNGEVIET